MGHSLTPLSERAGRKSRESRGAPRVATVRRTASPNFFYKHEVDITITLYFTVRVRKSNSSTSPPTYTPRLPDSDTRSTKSSQNSERHLPWQHRRTTWP